MDRGKGNSLFNSDVRIVKYKIINKIFVKYFLNGLQKKYPILSLLIINKNE